MIDAACNYFNPLALTHANSVMQQNQHRQLPLHKHDQQQPTNDFINEPNANCNSKVSSLSMYVKQITASTALASAQMNGPSMKVEIQYPPQASSTGSASANSNISLSAASSTSASPSVLSLAGHPFATIHASPLTAGGSPSACSSSSAAGAETVADMDATVASTTYAWSSNTYTSLPARTQYPYAQYASNYYGNVATVGMAASASAAWFSHQERLYQPWSPQSYTSFDLDEIAFQTQLQRRSVRCTCPNCSNELTGLPPIVGPDERGRKQHICHIPGCERLYGKASHLKTHLRWHTGERPFLCLTCGKRFSRSDELQRHGRTHTNYRPYACTICSKKFSRSDHLSKHKKTHFKDKNTRKALVTGTKRRSTSVKQEKSYKTLQLKKSPNATTSNAKTCMAYGKQLKQDLSDNQNRFGCGHSINRYQQCVAAAAAVLHDLSPPQVCLDYQADIDNNSDHFEPLTNINRRKSVDVDQNQSVKSTSIRSLSISNNKSSSSRAQHFATLAMQSGSKVTTEYGLTISELPSGASDTISEVYCCSNDPMNSDNTSNYPTELSNSSGYAYGYHHSVYNNTHHHHNSWAAAYYPHATA